LLQDIFGDIVDVHEQLRFCGLRYRALMFEEWEAHMEIPVSYREPSADSAKLDLARLS